MRTVPCRSWPKCPRPGEDAHSAKDVCSGRNCQSCRAGILLGRVTFGVGQNSCDNTIGRGLQNSARIKSRWRLLERILGRTRKQPVFDSRTKNGPGFRGRRAEVKTVAALCERRIFLSELIDRRYKICLICGSMRTFGGFRSGEEFFFGELHDEDVHVLAKPYWIEITPTGEMRKLADLNIDVPVAPSKLIAVGLNYFDHIAEMKRTPLGTPLIWFKAPSSLLPHGGTIEIAFPEHRTDFEVELAIVIGAPTKNVSAQVAPDHVFGYATGLDISDRDLQDHEKQFSRCKSFDTYTPVGPFVYADVDISDLSIELRQNGELRQHARMSQMIYSVAQIVSFASQSMTLVAGDVILTGTPSGVGPIHADDQLEASIDNWPPLRNSVTNART